MKKLIYSLILILCITMASVSASAMIEANADSENNKIVVFGTAEKKTDIPLMLFKSLDEVKLSATNIKAYAIHIVSATTDDEGNIYCELPMKADYEGAWYTFLTEGEDLTKLDSGLKIYYPTSEERTNALAAVNGAETSLDMEKALVQKMDNYRYADVLGVSLSIDEYADYTEEFCKTLVSKKPADNWQSVIGFRNDYAETIGIYTRYVNALKEINMATRQGLTDVIKNHNDILKLELSDKYSSYTLEINKLLVGKNYKSLDAFKTAFKKAVEDYKPSKSETSGVGGLGGGSRGGGGSVTVEKVETTDKLQTENAIFTDIGNVEWARDSIVRLANGGIVAGTGNNLFAPNTNVTREQFVKMLLLALNLPVNNSDTKFADVADSDWFAPYVMSAFELGVVTGKGDGNFGSGEFITREDMAVMVVRATQKAGKILTEKMRINYIDENDISGYAKECVQVLSEAGIITGMPDGSFAPMNYTTRAQAAVVLDRLMQSTEG